MTIEDRGSGHRDSPSLPPMSRTGCLRRALGNSGGTRHGPPYRRRCLRYASISPRRPHFCSARKTVGAMRLRAPAQ
jgi:hypothetical protein